MRGKILENPREQKTADVLKNWMMAVLTLIFVFLYATALFGWLKPLTDVTMIARLEPIIFVIIGYYFGRLPAQQNEKTLKDEIKRQTQKAETIQQVKEQIYCERETLEEKIKNARAVLKTHEVFQSSPQFSNSEDSSSIKAEESRRNSTIIAAVNILDS